MGYLNLFDDMRMVILIVICIFLIAVIVWRTIGYRRVRALSEMQKNELLNNLCEPLGYEYVQSQDIFITRLDAWQGRFGYEAVFDELAVTAGMIFDCFPVYFDYKGKTWLLEFWKGQYGITAGGEIGIYHADHLVKPEDYRETHYEAASLLELLDFGLYLRAGNEKLLDYRKRHWWLGAFRVGRHIKPEKIRALYQIRFFDPEMKEAFMQGLLYSGYPAEKIRDQGSCVVRILQTTETYLRPTWFRRFRTALVGTRNFLLNALYHLYTIPFRTGEDRLLFLYFQLPFVFRKLLNIKKYRAKRNRKQRYHSASQR